MRKHALKIFIGLYAVLVIGVILFCLNLLSKVDSMENKVETETQVLHQRLDSTDSQLSFEKPFDTEDILSHVRANWTRTPNVPNKNLPANVLIPPIENN